MGGSALTSYTVINQVFPRFFHGLLVSGGNSSCYIQEKLFRQHADSRCQMNCLDLGFYVCEAFMRLYL